MCSPHNLSSSLSFVQASYADATVLEETYFLALFLQTINKAKKRDRIQEDIDWLIWKLELEISRQSYYSA